MLGGVEHRCAGLHAGVVHHHVQASKTCDGLVDDVLNVRDVGHVALNGKGAASRCDDLAFDLISRLPVRVVVNGDGRPGAAQSHRDRAPDAAVASRNDGDLVLQ